MAAAPLRFSLVAQTDKNTDDRLDAVTEKKELLGLASHVKISSNEKHIFVGTTTSPCYVRAWYRNESAIRPLELMGPMVGGLRDFDISLQQDPQPSCSSETTWVYCVAVVTFPGWIYLWRVEFQEMASCTRPELIWKLHKCIKADENLSGPASVIGFLGDYQTLIIAGSLPFQNLCLLNTCTGMPIALISPLCYTLPSCPSSSVLGKETASKHIQETKKLALFDYTCLVVDPVPSLFPQGGVRETGHWVALGDTDSFLALLFVPNSLLYKLACEEELPTLTKKDVYSHTAMLCSSRIKSIQVAFRPHLINTRHYPKVSILFSDGWIRHWSLDSQRLKVALSDADKSRVVRSFCYGPLIDSEKNESHKASYPVLLVASNRERYPLHESFLNGDTSSLGVSDDVHCYDSYVLHCWSVSICSDHGQRNHCVIHCFQSPIAGLALCRRNSLLVVLTQDDSLFMFSAQYFHSDHTNIKATSGVLALNF